MDSKVTFGEDLLLQMKVFLQKSSLSTFEMVSGVFGRAWVSFTEG
jgi:hypothetical protein